MLDLLLQRVAANPNHSESWRSLGRLQSTLGDTGAAIESNRRAIALDPFNAAAHFDLGQLMLAVGQAVPAQSHFDQVFAIAPTSNYANELLQQGIQATAPPAGPPVPANPPSGGLADPNGFAPASLAPPTPAWDPQEDPFGRNLMLFESGPLVTAASYEIQSFDGADDLQQRVNQIENSVTPPVGRLRVFLESGVLYNTNITLTPISRELAQSDKSSFQAFANPDIDWKWIQSETFRAGPLMRGYFTANESEFQQFNLASFQPGFFAERDTRWGASEAILRGEYVFSNDFFDGDAVGNRHAATASMTLIRPSLAAYYGYLTVAQSDFANDGTLPSQTSLDGTTVTAGISRFFQTGWRRLPMHALGIDFESAMTEGDDYRYQSVNLHGSTGWLITERLKFIPTWGVGYRDYGDFTGAVSRNELFWRAHGRLQLTLSPKWSVSAVCGHDRFASKNEDFDTQRTEGGLVVTFMR
jgi:tetratricopeptide (TPR) repeat protein